MRCCTLVYIHCSYWHISLLLSSGPVAVYLWRHSSVNCRPQHCNIVSFTILTSQSRKSLSLSRKLFLNSVIQEDLESLLCLLQTQSVGLASSELGIWVPTFPILDYTGFLCFTNTRNNVKLATLYRMSKLRLYQYCIYCISLNFSCFQLFVTCTKRCGWPLINDEECRSLIPCFDL